MWLKSIAISICLLGVPHCTAQSIDTTTARLTIGQPIAMALHVRPGDLPSGYLQPDCVRAELQFGETRLESEQIRIRTRPDGEGTRVSLSNPAVLTEPIAQVRITLVCGASFVREFTVLGDPPLADHALTTAGTPQPTHRPMLHPHRSQHVRTLAPTPSAATPASSHSISRIVASPSLSESQLAAIASAVLALMQNSTRATEPAPHAAAIAAIPPIEPAQTRSDSRAAWMQAELDRLREQQDQSTTAINILLTRLEHQDRIRWMQTAWMIGTVLFTLLAVSCVPTLWHVLRLGWPRRIARAPLGSPDAGAANPEPAPPEHETEPAHVETWPAVLPPAPTQRHIWPDASFGQATLAHEQIAALLIQIDALMLQDYPGACAIALEQTLQNGPGKHPALLLRLLDVYRLLQQPSNHERVCAQIEALYNVRVPAMNTIGDEGPGLDEAMPALLDGISRQWRRPEGIGSLTRMLVRPCTMPPFGLAAFRDLLLLHMIATEPESAAPAPSADDDILWNLSMLPDAA